MLNHFYLLSYIIGVIFAYQQVELPSWKEAILLSIVILVLRPWPSLQRTLMAAALGVGAVFLAASYHQSKRLAPELWQVPQETVIFVLNHQRVKSFLQQYEVSSEEFGQTFELNAYENAQRLEPGFCYKVNLKLKPKNVLANPHTAHYEKNFWARRSFIQGILITKKPVEQLECQGSLLSSAQLKLPIREFIDATPVSEIAGYLLRALVLGERAALTDLDWEILQKTGTAHLLAISGLHIGLVYVFTFWLVKWLLRPLSLVLLRVNLFAIASVFALISSGVYVWISGAGVSSLRAWGMLGLMTLLALRREHLHALSVLILAVTVILIIDPLAGMGMGLWLSAGAVFALIWLSAGGWQVHWKLPLIMLPVSSLWLNSALLGPLANAVAIPLVSFLIVPAALLAVLMNSLNIPGADFLIMSSGTLLDYLWIFLRQLSHFAWMHHWSLLTVIDKLLFWSLIGCLLLPWRFLGPIPFVILIAALSFPKPIFPEPGTLTMDVIDAGQGTAILIRTGDKNLLFDAGSGLVKDYLRYYRINHLDMAVISHNDMDHRAGLASLVKAVTIDQLYVGEQLSEVPIEKQMPCRQGQNFSWGETYFEFLSPISDFHQGNNASCVLKITHGTQSILLTGDIEKKVERELLASHIASQLASTILIAPHHGSKTSSTYEFIQAVSPEIVIYPTGFLNSYHHPHPDIVTRYTHFGAKQFNTAQDGALRVKLSEFGFQSIHCYKKDHPRWWARKEENSCSGFLAQAGP